MDKVEYKVKSSIGSIIKEIREAKGLTRSDLGDKFGMSDAHLYDIEQARNYPSGTERVVLMLEDMGYELIIKKKKPFYCSRFGWEGTQCEDQCRVCGKGE